MTTWRVGAILKESVSDTLKFVSWYLEAGADGITLLFDDPNDPAIELIEPLDKVTCYRCTREFWLEIGSHPDRRFTKRQNQGLMWVYHNTTEDWLLNVDSDELLYLHSGTFADRLAEQSEKVTSVSISVAEVVGVEGKSEFVFRRPMRRYISRILYGENAQYFGPKRMGLVGHCEGKSATRTGIGGLRMRQHWADIPESQRGENTSLGPDLGVELLHFIGLDYEPWRRKLEWRMFARGFTRPLKAKLRLALESDNSEEALRDLHLKLHYLSAEDVDKLIQMNAGFKLSLDLKALVSKYFPEVRPQT